MKASADLFRRLVLPGFAFKAVVIGGGYATGREIAEFFIPAGPWGGLAAMLLATLIWSSVAAATFWYAWRTEARDYRAFFEHLLGRFGIVFELLYVVFLVLILAVFGAAAGAIGTATMGVPAALGTIALMVGIVACVAAGNRGVERVFLWVSVLLYATYALFFAFALGAVGPRIVDAFASAEAPTGAGWVAGGVTYAGYNIIGAAIVLPVTRHFRRGSDAIVAGLVAGPLAMLPALLFFIGMIAFLPDIATSVLPSDHILSRLDQPWFHVLFQMMIFAALLESGTGGVHAIAERVAHTRGMTLTPARRAILALVILVPCMLVAERVGLVALIASGYRLLAIGVLLVFVLPLIATILVRRDGVPHPRTETA